MMGSKNAYRILLLICAIGCNKTDAQTNGMEGVWRAIVNDSIYSEVLITPQNMHSSEGHTGNFIIISKMLFAYSTNNMLAETLCSHDVKGDSLILYNRDIRVGSFVINKRKPNELFLHDNDISLHLKRLGNKQLLEEVINIDTLTWDNKYFSKYLEGYYKRRNEYELRENANR